MEAFALVTSAPQAAVDVFIRREDADSALADCLEDEPGWAGVLSVVPIEFDDRGVSAN